MALKFPDWTWETSTTTGTAAYALAGAVSQNLPFSKQLSDQDTVYVSVSNGTDYEEGLYTYNTTGNTLSRTVIYRSVVGGTVGTAAVSWAAGTKQVKALPLGFALTPSLNGVPNMTSFTALTTRPLFVMLDGYATAGDGGGGLFVWVAGDSTTADSATVVQPSGSPAGRYKRLFTGAVDPMWFGAKCDGMTDDAAALTAALNSAYDVLLPNRVCAIGSQVKVTSKGLLGSGPLSTLKALSASFNLVNIAGKNIRIRNISFQGAAIDATTIQNGVQTDPTTVPADFEISGCRFGNLTATASLNCGIYMQGFGERDFRVFGNHFENLIGTVSGTGYGILTGAVSDGTIFGNTFYGTRGTCGRHAVYLSGGAARVVVSGNVTENFNFEAYTLNHSAGQPVNDTITFANNIARSCGGDGVGQASISVFGGAKNILIEGNQIVASYGTGIYVDAAGRALNDIVIAGNRIVDPKYSGIYILGAKYQKVANNVISGASQIAAQTYVDIVLGSDGTTAPAQVLVTGNQGIGTAGVSRSPFTLNLTTPLPLLTKVYGNDFPATNYLSGPVYGTTSMTVWIDGRIQYVQSWTPPSIANGASYILSGITIPGADQGDVVTVGYTGNIDGMILFGQASGTNSVEVMLANLSGATKTATPGSLRIDVWKRDGYGL